MICLNNSMDIKPPFRLPIAPTAQLGQARQQEFRMSMLKLTPFNFIPAHPVISLFKPIRLFLSFQPQGVDFSKGRFDEVCDVLPIQFYSYKVSVHSLGDSEGCSASGKRIEDDARYYFLGLPIFNKCFFSFLFF